MKKKYLEDIILLVVKPLYGLVEVGNHLFAIYLDYYKEKLKIKILLYDACLFITKNNIKNFDIAKFQINNTLNIRTEAFMKKKETKIIEAKFKEKLKQF